MWTKPVPVVFSTKLVAGEKFAGAIAERMLIFELAEMTAIEAADDLITFPAAFFSDGRAAATQRQLIVRSPTCTSE